MRLFWAMLAGGSLARSAEFSGIFLASAFPTIMSIVHARPPAMLRERKPLGAASSQKESATVIIKAICFDADGVVVNPQLQFARYLEKEHSISPEMTRSFFRGIFNDCLVGKADLKNVLPTFLRDWGWKGSVDEFINIWLLTDHLVDARVINTVQSLRNSGMICCLTTSQEYNRAEYMKAKMGFQDVFDRLFFSCEIGWQKHHDAFYQYVEKALRLEKESILFWDDSQTNIAAAREHGWNAEIYTNFEEFEKTTKKYIAKSNRA